MIDRRSALVGAIGITAISRAVKSENIHQTSAPYVVHNRAQPILAERIETNLEALRKISDNDILSGDEKFNLNIPASGIIAAVYNVKSAKTILMQAGLGSEDLNNSSRAVSAEKVRQIRDILKANDATLIAATSREPGTWLVPSPDGSAWHDFRTTSQGSFAYYRINDVAVVNALAADAIDLHTTQIFAGYPEIEAYGLAVGPNAEQMNVARQMSAILAAKPVEVAAAYQKLRDNINRYDSFSRGLMLALGRITFGYVTPIRARETSFNVPSNIDRDFDCFWLEFNVTYRDLQSWWIDELAFNVDLPDGCYAFEVAPLRFGPTVRREDNLTTPEIEVQGVSIGEFFGRKIAYDYIKPVVVASGRGESAVSWSLTDEAVSLGSHIFAAVVGVPKGSAGIELGLSAHVKVNDFIPINGRIAGTEVFKREILF